MSKSASIAFVALTSFMLWTPALLSGSNGQIAMFTMIGGVAAAIGVLWRAFETRKQSLVVLAAATVATAWISVGTWRLLRSHPPLLGAGIDPFAGPVALWAIFTFALGLATVATGLWALTKRQRLYRYIGFALGASLVFTSRYFFQLVTGV